MKKTLYLLLPFLALALTNCENVLDQVPQDRIDLEEYFKTRDDAESALTGAYDVTFRDVVPGFVLNNSLSAREMEHIGDIKLRQVQYRPVLRTDNDGGTGTLWANSYRALARINLVLDRVPNIPESYFQETGVPATRNRKAEILGEARFLRAWIYYNLTMNWGDVPLVLNYPTSALPGNNQVARTPQADVFKQIQDDLTFAEANLPLNHTLFRANQSAAASRIQSKGRATRGMAKLMLARLALQNKLWQLAADKAREIMQSGQYTLNSLWTQTFNNLPAGGQNATESILETQSIRDGFVNTGGIFSWEFYTNGRLQLTQQWYNNYDGDYLAPRDVRQFFSSNIQYNADGSFRGNTLLKYYNRDNAYASADPFNYVLGRLAEVHLIRAEALNELNYPDNEALTLLNGLRARARDLSYTVTVKRKGRADTTVAAVGIAPVSFGGATTTLRVTNQVEFRKVIRDERWRELAFEGQQWYDLLRWDAQDGTKNALKSVYLDDPAVSGTNSGKIFWPIPDAEIRVNAMLKQNAGY